MLNPVLTYFLPSITCFFCYRSSVRSCPQEEPRLARKLLEPLANVVQTTPAKSLMYEAISTITYALQHTKRPDGSDAKNAPAVVRLCTDRLREMVRACTACV